MMGTSARFVFLHRPDAGLVEIIPHENIARLVVVVDVDTEAEAEAEAGAAAAAPATPAESSKP
jgi:hypothetical protein